MAAVDSFDTKKFFFLFQIDRGGGGVAQSRPMWSPRVGPPLGAVVDHQLDLIEDIYVT